MERWSAFTRCGRRGAPAWLKGKKKKFWNLEILIF
jgi:hypothetical protein